MNCSIRKTCRRHAGKIDHTATITEVDRNSSGTPHRFTLETAPSAESPVPLEYTVYAADWATSIGSVPGSLDRATRAFTIDPGNSDEVLQAIDDGAKLRMDNRWTIAYTTYHRHQVPIRPGFYAWDQFRNADGSPKYPQRALEIGPLISANISGGGTFSGQINGKIIVISNLLNTDAFPWQADWYAQQVKTALGNRFDDNFRVWFTDHADHVDPHNPRLVNYGGMYEQALRDVAAWAERGVKPARSTRYKVIDSQILVPRTAAGRRGIQPVVDLTVRSRHHKTRTVVRVGQTVTLVAKIKVPPRAGRIVAAGWDPNGRARSPRRPLPVVHAEPSTSERPSPTQNPAPTSRRCAQPTSVTQARGSPGSTTSTRSALSSAHDDT